MKPQTSLDWLSIIILLDQLPRNCYRAANSAVVFTFYDSRALAIAEEAIKAGIPSKSPDVRYRLALRFWFYLPLIHSEDLAIQDRALELYEEMVEDIRAVLESDIDEFSLSEKEKKYCETLRNHPTEVKNFCTLHMRVQKDHRDQSAWFGRYPHRNQVLERASTPEEREFLKEGKDFG